MASTPSSSSRRHQSLFFRDLASPISSHRYGDRFSTPISSLRFDASSTSAATAEPPPPPVFTLDDRLDFSPEPYLPPTPEPAPTPERNYQSTPPSARPRPDGSPASGTWWSPMRDGRGSDEKAAAAGGRSGSPVEGVVQQRAPSVAAPPALLMLPPPPREVARPEMRSNLPPASAAGGMDEEEWVTVYGFLPGDTNLVLREFEKCGVILKHVPGPRDANWMHILYQSRYDAQKALGKNGVQLNSALIIGVKPVDPVQRQYLNERLNGGSGAHGGFMVSSHPQLAGRIPAVPTLATSQPSYQPNGGSTDAHNKEHHSTGAIASPAKSVVSKMFDLMFGL